MTTLTSNPLAWEGWKNFICTNRVHECRGTDSFYFAPEDGSDLPPFEPGQYVSLRLPSVVLGEKIARPYTISQMAGYGTLRLTVKEAIGADGITEGVLSHIIHRSVKIGSVVELTAPTGSFVLDKLEEEHPIVFIAGGIGISAIVPMLEKLSTETPLRKIHVLYVARNGERYPLKKDLEEAVKGMPNAAKAVFFTQPGENDRLGVDFDAEGMLTPERIRSFCQDPDADFYVCGPEKFTEEMAEALRSISIIGPRIHTNSFGLGI